MKNKELRIGLTPSSSLLARGVVRGIIMNYELFKKARAEIVNLK